MDQHARRVPLVKGFARHMRTSLHNTHPQPSVCQHASHYAAGKSRADDKTIHLVPAVH